MDKKFRRIITLEELKENDGTNGKNHWILIDGRIYDVSHYDHPGGIEVWKQEDPDNFEDFSEKFEGHSDIAIKLKKKFYIGNLKTE